MPKVKRLLDLVYHVHTELVEYYIPIAVLVQLDKFCFPRLLSVLPQDVDIRQHVQFAIQACELAREDSRIVAYDDVGCVEDVPQSVEEQQDGEESVEAFKSQLLIFVLCSLFLVLLLGIVGGELERLREWV
jgi:hypothetical protein